MKRVRFGAPDRHSVSHKMESNRNGHVGFLFPTLKRYNFTVGLMCLWVLSAESHKCPYFCQCDDTSVTCKDSGEIKLPFNVSWSIQILTLKGYNITTLTERAFAADETGMELHTLALRHNKIQVIETCAFCGLSRLRTLDLSLNNLMVVSPEAFQGLGELRYLYLNSTLTSSGTRELPSALSADSLRNLQRLELSGNQLKAMPLSGFGNLNLTTLVLTNNSLETLDKNNISNLNEFKKIRVYLAMNPFNCDCESQAFYYWLRNGSQCADASRVQCAQSNGSNGTPVEKFYEMACRSKDLEAVSYVFLGIVLALIGVVFLMVLYLNRRGIKRWLNNIREACRDQMEVYHYRYEQDSDPRLANVAV